MLPATACSASEMPCHRWQKAACLSASLQPCFGGSVCLNSAAIGPRLKEASDR